MDPTDTIIGVHIADGVSVTGNMDIHHIHDIHPRPRPSPSAPLIDTH